MPIPPKIQLALGLYDWIWGAAMPLSRLNSRLRDGYGRRRNPEGLSAADVWIQAASAGEAYLALSLIENLNPPAPTHVLVTTNTRQGLDILGKSIGDRAGSDHVTAACEFAPFDRPKLMDAAILRVRPKLMVLLETELWPGLLFAAKKHGIPVLLINGRLTPKSLGRYMMWPDLWKILGPDRILAISEEDAGRFAALFGRDRVEQMSNIKFDRLNTKINDRENPLTALLSDSSPFLVLGSVRQPEEESVARIIGAVRSKAPDAIIGLFPRHMHRISAWEQILSRLNIPWIRRSDLNAVPAPPGHVILWDTFGELTSAYGLARAVFVGGSLAPLGGQNFLEPMICGVTPIIGPSWENFAWAGRDIFDQGLAIRADDWQGVAEGLIAALRQSSPSDGRKAKACRYIEGRKGGTRQACRVMEDLLAQP
ncbi:MAG: 3-deoxy-D-manno-octulosonic acid transferase, partial [Desulfobacterales bacterium CG23_combo_of_CG06-09_8_20_14_all_51_8]